MWEPCDELFEECREVLSRMISFSNVWKMIKSIGNNAYFQDTCYQVCSSQLFEFHQNLAFYFLSV